VVVKVVIILIQALLNQEFQAVQVEVVVLFQDQV
jgi:hypothetical protein